MLQTDPLEFLLAVMDAALSGAGRRLMWKLDLTATAIAPLSGRASHRC